MQVPGEQPQCAVRRVFVESSISHGRWCRWVRRGHLIPWSGCLHLSAAQGRRFAQRQGGWVALGIGSVLEGPSSIPLEDVGGRLSVLCRGGNVHRVPRQVLIGMQGPIRKNLLEFKFYPRSLEFVDLPDIDFKNKNFQSLQCILFPIQTSRLCLLIQTKE